MLLPTLLAGFLAANAALHPETPGVAVRHATLQGVPLCVWNDSSLFTKLKGSMQERGDRVFRFPNGSYSDIYHWNGSGSYDADSVWIADNATYAPGWAGGSRYRGMTNGADYSHINDGDTSSLWWSNPDHPSAPGWFMIDLGGARSFDSLSLWLGSVRPDSVEVLFWASSNGVYPPPPQKMTNLWSSALRLPASALVGHKFAEMQSQRYVAVRPVGHVPKGWQVREFKLNAGTLATTRNVPSKSQNAMFAISTHPAGQRNPNLRFTWDFEAYMAWMRNYPGSDPLICVNYGTGTPQEAAAWVHYANKVKGYGIKRWQVGNEMSGTWEEGGCVTARQYAERFVQFAKAMKAVDPSILIQGPVLASTDFVGQASGDYDGRSWMQGFLTYVDSVEKAIGSRLVDGIDFHTYPYYFSAKPSADAMMLACDGNGAHFDTLVSLMGRTIADPTSREILMTEFNTSVVSSSLEMTAAGGSAAALQFAHFIQRFGNRGITNLWELYEGGNFGPDGTYGTLSDMVAPTQGAWSSLGYAPNASFWSTRTIMKQWLDLAGGDTILPIDQVAGLRLFAVRNAGRVSVLAFNLGRDSAVLNLDAADFPGGGDILSWGEGEYKWLGTGADARAIPNNGPSSKPFATWGGSAKVPPYGMLVVRGAGRAAQGLHTGHWLLSSQSLSIQDTLILSGWTTSEGAALKGGTWTVGPLSGALEATDGAWDGATESWLVRIPGSALGEGPFTAKVSLVDGADRIVSDSQVLEVTGALRPILLISDFNDRKPSAMWSDWGSWSADNKKVGVVIDTQGCANSSYCMTDTVTMSQPTGLGYTVFFRTDLVAPPNLKELHRTYKLMGVRFDYKTSHSSSSGNFAFGTSLSTVTDFDNYAMGLANTQGVWVTDTILFNNMKQGGWGKAVPFQVDSLTGIEFRANGAGKAMIALDNIYLLGTKGDSVTVSVPVSMRRPAFNLVGRRLSIESNGPWALRLVSADGRVSGRWSGNGASSFELPRTTGPQWAILESHGMRRMLSVPPLMR